MRRNERIEFIYAFNERLRSASMNLHILIFDENMVIFFKVGLPVNLQDQANIMSGDYSIVFSSLENFDNSINHHQGDNRPRRGDTKSFGRIRLQDPADPIDWTLFHQLQHYAMLTRVQILEIAARILRCELCSIYSNGNNIMLTVH